MAGLPVWSDPEALQGLADARNPALVVSRVLFDEGGEVAVGAWPEGRLARVASAIGLHGGELPLGRRSMPLARMGRMAKTTGLAMLRPDFDLCRRIDRDLKHFARIENGLAQSPPPLRSGATGLLRHRRLHRSQGTAPRRRPIRRPHRLLHLARAVSRLPRHRHQSKRTNSSTVIPAARIRCGACLWRLLCGRGWRASHSRRPSQFNGLGDVFQRLLLGLSLADTAGNRRAFHDPHPVFVAFNGVCEFHWKYLRPFAGGASSLATTCSTMPPAKSPAAANSALTRRRNSPAKVLGVLGRRSSRWMRR